jgi:hypothetical protein
MAEDRVRVKELSIESRGRSGQARRTMGQEGHRGTAILPLISCSFALPVAFSLSYLPPRSLSLPKTKP